MKKLISDYCGHPFQFEFRDELTHRGHSVLHMYTSFSGDPKVITSNAYPKLKVVDIKKPNVEKQNFLKRWRQESKYGRKAIEIFKQF